MAESELRDKRGVDVVGLVFGIGTLLASAYMLTDGRIWPDFLDLRLLLAGGAMVIGIGLLAGSMRRRR
ncbi:hypothetical protein [Saccharothrix coeruleofusca]|uniref:Uncharacterized protein n=1 Tax=Saccharothrix coeruleofusca TaxID=33919 RepID=A0A918AP64_9PSEU|nr:hypothetical protein [Saccharothrix coeruleofusca]MBP2339311.1 hypothetical protein [Saccharothrix coeruleofusca]GGP58644.1 hypothetical protein GCM10010185_33890 [Saccharothrix coeruleofusca]